ncbi:hypothetical protein YPPY65_2636, partial [Yersinia pestis PY-65]
MQFAS